MSKPAKYEKLIRFVIISTLWTIFGALSYQAIRKYWYEPIATEIFYTEGEDGRIVFPKITLCPYEFVKNSLESCGNGNSDYLQAIESCLQRENSSLHPILQKLRYNREDYFGDVFNLYEPKTTQNDQNLLWSPVIHARFGLCYTIDVEKSERYNSDYLFHSRKSKRIDVFRVELKNITNWKIMGQVAH